MISEQEFDELVIRKSQSIADTNSQSQDLPEDNDDLASLSGSESEEEEEELDYGKDGNFKVFMVNSEQTVISFHKCLCPDPSSPSLPPSWHHGIDFRGLTIEITIIVLQCRLNENGPTYCQHSSIFH